MFFLSYVMKIKPLKNANTQDFLTLTFQGNPGVISSLLRILIYGVTNDEIRQRELLQYLLDAEPHNKAIIAVMVEDGVTFHPNFRLAGLPVSVQNTIRLAQELYDTFFHLEEEVLLRVVYPSEFILSYLTVVQQELEQTFVFKDYSTTEPSIVERFISKLEIPGEKISTFTEVVLEGSHGQIYPIVKSLY